MAEKSIMSPRPAQAATTGAARAGHHDFYVFGSARFVPPILR
jgi:hypothetical protein